MLKYKIPQIVTLTPNFDLPQIPEPDGSYVLNQKL